MNTYVRNISHTPKTQHKLNITAKQFLYRSLNVIIYTYSAYIYICISEYLYIYIHREREIEKDSDLRVGQFLYVYNVIYSF